MVVRYANSDHPFLHYYCCFQATKTTNTRLIATPDDDYPTEGEKRKQKWEPEIYTLCYDVIIYI